MSLFGVGSHVWGQFRGKRLAPLFERQCIALNCHEALGAPNATEDPRLFRRILDMGVVLRAATPQIGCKRGKGKAPPSDKFLKMRLGFCSFWLVLKGKLEGNQLLEGTTNLRNSRFPLNTSP